MSDLFDVSGKTALVTGGSRGIGLMIARGLVQGGARVIVSSRKSADVEAAAQELSELGDCHAIPADISTQQGAQALAAATRERFPSLDILVNNAGAVWGAPLEEFPAGGWDKVLHTNVEGVFHLTVALHGARQSRGALWRGDVAGNRDAVAELRELVSGRRDVVGLARGDDHSRAGLDEAARDHQADPARAAGHGRGLAG